MPDHDIPNRYAMTGNVGLATGDVRIGSDVFVTCHGAHDNLSFGSAYSTRADLNRPRDVSSSSSNYKRYSEDHMIGNANFQFAAKSWQLYSGAR
jgi:hypothetical protein